MDSITHLVLGAALGELTLGRKIGNRALVWGAIGETIPDLDVLSGPFLSDLDAMAFHRGFTHSVVFAITAPLLIGWLVYRLYATGFHKTKGYKAAVSLFNILGLLALTTGINLLFRGHPLSLSISLLITLSLSAYLIYRLVRYYWKKELEQPSTTFRDWYILFLVMFATHITLDCFTAFGTQVFQPFSNYRVAFNNISVVDPLYTIPFLICVILMARLPRNTRRRTVINYVGIFISCFYLLLTLVNKWHVDKVFSSALANRHILPERTRSTATIFNNVLWACVAEDADHYYVTDYSLFDSDPNLHYLSVLPKNDSIRTVLSPNKEYQKLRWFTDGYLAEFKTDSAFFLCDLRYGGWGDTIRDHRDLFMNFKVTQQNGQYQFQEYREPLKGGDFSTAFGRLWTRIKGY